MSRLFVGSRGIFLENRTILSPNSAVRCSRSNGCRPPCGFGVASFRIIGATNGSSSLHTAEPVRGCAGWTLSIGASLELGARDLELFMSVARNRFVQVQDDAAH